VEIHYENGAETHALTRGEKNAAAAAQAAAADCTRADSGGWGTGGQLGS